jgi:hypothetical protein
LSECRQGKAKTYFGLKLRPEPAEADLGDIQKASVWSKILAIRGQGNTSLTKEDFLWAFEILPRCAPFFFPKHLPSKSPDFLGVFSV